MDAYLHARSSVKAWGGSWEDYHQIHLWIDGSKTITADPRHRALRHHAEGISLCVQIFGPIIKNSDGRTVMTRHIAERHVQEDLGRIPSWSDWCLNIAFQPWMMGPRRSKRHPITTLKNKPEDKSS